MGEHLVGNLLIIGGNEDKTGECVILRKFIDLAGGHQANIAVVTTATEAPEEAGEQYYKLFQKFGAASTHILNIENRELASSPEPIAVMEACSGIFFTGGDQLRLTSLLGGSGIDAAIRRAYERGTIIAGTSAGASAMSDTMIVDGPSSDTLKKSTLSMAHGIGLLAEVVIDQHFAQRGRMNRLMAAVAQNPHIIGVGIDEDTALIVGADSSLEIIGSQTVTIVDGKNIIHSNISESEPCDPLALTNIIVHILSSGFSYDLKRRFPFLTKDDSETATIAWRGPVSEHCVFSDSARS